MEKRQPPFLNGLEEKTLLSSSSASPFLLFFLLLAFPSCLLLASTAPAADGASSYELTVWFQPEERIVNGTAHITLPPGQALTLAIDELAIISIRVNTAENRAMPGPIPDKQRLDFPATGEERKITVSYTRQIQANDPDNLISHDGIVLTTMWHPIPNQKMAFRLAATVPEGFSAIAESDLPVVRATGEKQPVFSWSQPVHAIHFAAGPYVIRTKEIRPGLTVSTWFFRQDAALSDGYLEAATRFTNRYEQELGPFPYTHYAIVANLLPSGFGFPTFTLLGRQVIRLPFIKDTSLGHEILHSWLGNSVGVRSGSGNWCEGLTSYLADFAYAEDQGQGAAHRKESIINYMSYVTEQNVLALADFHSASHNQPMAKAVRAVGYNRGAMFFHELKHLIGPLAFTQGMRQLVRQYRGQDISWDEIRAGFEQVSRRDLQSFFQQRLERPYLPDLFITDVRNDEQPGKSLIRLTVEQHSERPFTLMLPILVRTAHGEQRHLRAVSEARTTIELPVDGPPTELIVDPDYDCMRVLSPKELPPVWSRFLGSPKKTVVLASDDAAEVFAPLLQTLADDTWTVVTADKVSNQDLGQGAFLFLGLDSPASRSLFAVPDHPHQGFTLDVRVNPLNPSQVVVLMSSSSAAETAAVTSRLSHYGKYSRLFFQQGQIREKSIQESDSGLHVPLDPLPVGGAVANLGSFDAMMGLLDQYRVVYVGETHTSMADHLLQFRIIEALHRKNPNLAIGMEMFPGSSQAALNAYINDETIDEKTFLRASRYFEVWRYDWRFFRAIFNYARSHKIPVIGLNLEREIVSTIFKDGHTDLLGAEQKEIIPGERDLDMPGYTERLRKIHGFHNQNPHGEQGGLAGFIQAQAIWDETMAETTAAYLLAHPTTRMVVLAGSQHTRKDSGIPPRVARRLAVSQATVVNLHSASRQDDIRQTADYFFLTDPVDLEPLGKMGLVLTDGKVDGKSGLTINDISPHSKAGQRGIIEKGDILLAINGATVNTMEDVRLALMDHRPGDRVTLRVQRQTGKSEPMEKEVELELSHPEAGKPHP